MSKYNTNDIWWVGLLVLVVFMVIVVAIGVMKQVRDQGKVLVACAALCDPAVPTVMSGECYCKTKTGWDKK